MNLELVNYIKNYIKYDVSEHELELSMSPPLLFFETTTRPYFFFNSKFFV